MKYGLHKIITVMCVIYVQSAKGYLDSNFN